MFDNGTYVGLFNILLLLLVYIVDNILLLLADIEANLLLLLVDIEANIPLTTSWYWG